MRNPSESLALPGGVTIIHTIAHTDNATDSDGSTDCCAHAVRDGLSVTYPDGCTAEWDADGFTFTHAHPNNGDAIVTIDDEPESITFPDGYPNSSPDRYPDDAA